MPRLPLAAVALLVASRLAAAQPAPADLSTEATAALALPPSPAAMALLLPHTSHPAVVDRLASALRHADPEVRAVAARVVFTTRDQRLLDPLTAALGAESHAVPGAEMVRAAALIAGPSSDAAALAAIERLGKPCAEAWLAVVGRTRPADALAHLPLLGAAAGEVLEGLAAGQTDAVARAFAPLATTPALEPAYTALITRVDRATAMPPWSIVAPGLELSPSMRRYVVRILLRRRGAGLPLPPAADAALDRLRDAPATSGEPFLVMAFELARRRDQPGAAPVSLLPTIAALDPATVQPDLWRDSWLHRLDASEEKALRARVELLPRERWAPERGSGNTLPAAKPTPSPMVIRMVRPLTPRLIAELAEVTGCRPAPDQFIAVQVDFRPTGQVREVYQPIGVGLEKCGQAAKLLAALDIAGGSAPLHAGRTDLVLIGFRKEDAECLRVDMASVGREIRTSATTVRAPRKIRNVPPVYPRSMQDARIQGIVLVEATITPAGCVGDATVLGGPHTTLNAAALAAVSLWRYEPSLLNGKPVPIIMSVTVNFTLQ